MIKYKIDGKEVDRGLFGMLHPNPEILQAWEIAVVKKKNEIDRMNISVIFKITDGKFQVLTDTILLFTLVGELKNEHIHLIDSKSIIRD